MSRHKRHRIKLRSMYVWHRYIGIAAALLVILLAVTGLLLNHTDRLQLDRRHVTNETLLGWYGIEAPHTATAYRAGALWLVQLDTRLYLVSDKVQQRELAAADGPLQGALAYRDMLVVALGDRLLLLTPQGELIEQLGAAEGVPAAITGLGRTAHNRLALATSRGTFIADPDLLRWQPAGKAPAGIVWSQPAALPEALHDRLAQAYRGKGLPLERVILDLHSGRIIGPGGVYLMDAAAIGMLFLACSGIWLWLMRLIRNRQRQTREKRGKRQR